MNGYLILQHISDIQVVKPLLYSSPLCLTAYVQQDSRLMNIGVARMFKKLEGPDRHEKAEKFRKAEKCSLNPLV